MSFQIDLNTIVLLIVAAMNFYVAVMAKKTHTDMQSLEKNTNSMKDALVQSTAKASLAEGMAAGKIEERAEVAARKE